MSTRFDDWEGDFLAHHGIRGMKWGVRKYQNEDGSLTAAGKLRYGENGIGASAKRMQRDLNRLDKQFANAYGERERAAYIANKRATKLINSKSARKNPKKADKLVKKATKASEEYKAAAKRAQDIESLQWRIIGHAASKGYGVHSKAVARTAVTGKAKVAQLLGGVVGTAIYGSVAVKRGYATAPGQRFTVTDSNKRKINAKNLAAKRLVG